MDYNVFVSYNNIQYTYLIKYFHFHRQIETFNIIEYLISMKNRKKNLIFPGLIILKWSISNLISILCNNLQTFRYIFVKNINYTFFVFL